jgi:hypothetical protein
VLNRQRGRSWRCGIGARAELHHPVVHVPPQELLLSRHAEGLSDQPVRPAAQRRRLARSARRRAYRRRSVPTSRKTPARARTLAVPVAASTAATTR